MVLTYGTTYQPPRSSYFYLVLKGDFDNDGVVDIMVGSSNDDDGGTDIYSKTLQINKIILAKKLFSTKSDEIISNFLRFDISQFRFFKCFEITKIKK